MPQLRRTPDLVRHLYQALCLVLLLIAGQQGAVVHELGHVADAHGVDLRSDPGDAADGACGLCPAFAQVATPAFSHSFLPPVLARSGAERGAEPLTELFNTASLTPRSRGPPSSS